MMDHSKVTCELTSALQPWLNEALLYLRQQPDLMAELRKCMNGDGDVRIVFHTRANALTIEAADYAESTVAELFRQTLVPSGDGRFPASEMRTRILADLIGPIGVT